MEEGDGDTKAKIKKAVKTRESLMYQTKMYGVYLYTIIKSLEGLLFVCD